MSWKDEHDIFKLKKKSFKIIQIVQADFILPRFADIAVFVN